MLALLLLSASTFGNVVTDITPYNLPDTTVIIHFENAPSYVQLKGEKAYITYSKTSNSQSSKISVKGIECPLKISSWDFFSVYFRTRNDIKDIQFSLFKMETKGKKRLASSSSITGAKIKKLPYSISQMDPIKKVYSMQITSQLSPGIYGFAFVTISQNGHFHYNTFISRMVYCIEITE